MADATKENIIWEKNKVLEFTSSMMVKHMKENGKMASSMEMVK